MLASIALGFVGVVLLGIAYFLWMRTKQFVATAHPVKGTVISMLMDSEGASAPVFKFTASNGDMIEKRDTMYSTPPAHKVGDIVEILYDPNNPQDARVVKSSSLYFAPILLAVMGVVFIGSAVVWLTLRLLDLFF